MEGGAQDPTYLFFKTLSLSLPYFSHLLILPSFGSTWYYQSLHLVSSVEREWESQLSLVHLF